MYKKISNSTVERTFVTPEYTYWNNAFTNEEIDSIISYCEREELESAMTIGVDDLEKIEEIRKSKIKFFGRDCETSWMFERFNNVIDELNERFYNFNLNGYNKFQYTVYDSSVKGKYDWHMDTTLGHLINDVNFDDRETRKLTLVMLLSEPEVEFCGGDFQLYIGGDIQTNYTTPEMTKGKIICFPSFLIHRVKPVLVGVRKSIVIWVTGPKFI